MFHSHLLPIALTTKALKFKLLKTKLKPWSNGLASGGKLNLRRDLRSVAKLKNLHWLGCKFDLDQSDRKSTQVHARPSQTESQVDPSFQLAATCESVWLGLNGGAFDVWLSPYKLSYFNKATDVFSEFESNCTYPGRLFAGFTKLSWKELGINRQPNSMSMPVIWQLIQIQRISKLFFLFHKQAQILFNRQWQDDI